MKRWEVVALALFLACWLVYLLVAFQLVAAAGTLALDFYPYFSVGVVLGWAAGNLYVYRSRELERRARRPLLALYFLSPLGLIFLLKAMMPLEFQRAAPFVGVYAFCVYSIFFLVANKLGLWRKRPG